MISHWIKARSPQWLAACLAAATITYGQESKQMAITFDDLPFGYARGLTIDGQRAAVDRVLATLGTHQITSTVFVIGRSVSDANRGLVDAFARAGHIVGNHSFSHQDLAVVAAEAFIEDIQKGGEVLGPWLKGVHYFRYPFLRQGNTAQKRDAVLDWLASRGIVVAPALEATYDLNRTVTLVGAVSLVEWVNPHARLYVDVRNANGGITTWSVELGAPNTMIRYGLGPSVLKQGDQVSVDVWIAKDGSLSASGQVLRLADGCAAYVAAPWAPQSNR